MKLMVDPISSILESAMLLVKQQESRSSLIVGPHRPLLPLTDRDFLKKELEEEPENFLVEEETSQKQRFSTENVDDKDKSDRLGNIGLYIIRREGKFLYANPQLAKLFGYSFEELLELESILALVKKEDFDRLFDDIEQCIRGQNKNLVCQFQGKKKNGHSIRVEVFGSRTKFYGKSAIVGAIGEVSLSNQ
jgi:PAS domain S-box-containing protein